MNWSSSEHNILRAVCVLAEQRETELFKVLVCSFALEETSLLRGRDLGGMKRHISSE